MCTAFIAMHLNPKHSLHILPIPNLVALQRCPKAWPTSARVELSGDREEGLTATCASVDACFVVGLVQWAKGELHLSPLVPAMKMRRAPPADTEKRTTKSRHEQDAATTFTFWGQ